MFYHLAFGDWLERAYKIDVNRGHRTLAVAMFIAHAEQIDTCITPFLSASAEQLDSDSTLSTKHARIIRAALQEKGSCGRVYDLVRHLSRAIQWA